jgi:hypothetical protein
MLCPRPTPLNRRPNVPNLPDLHRRHPPAQRVRSSANVGRSCASGGRSDLGREGRSEKQAVTRDGGWFAEVRLWNRRGLAGVARVAALAKSFRLDEAEMSLGEPAQRPAYVAVAVWPRGANDRFAPLRTVPAKAAVL